MQLLPVLDAETGKRPVMSVLLPEFYWSHTAYIITNWGAFENDFNLFLSGLLNANNQELENEGWVRLNFKKRSRLMRAQLKIVVANQSKFAQIMHSITSRSGDLHFARNTLSHGLLAFETDLVGDPVLLYTIKRKAEWVTEAFNKARLLLVHTRMMKLRADINGLSEADYPHRPTLSSLDISFAQDIAERGRLRFPNQGKLLRRRKSPQEPPLVFYGACVTP